MITGLEKVAALRGPADECWLWPARVDRDGYGRCAHRGTETLVHRLAYEHHIGPIPPGLTVDHLCHSADPSCIKGPACPHRRCVNPAHLEAVTHLENTRRRAAKTCCRNGHPHSSKNTRIDSKGHRICRRCSAVNAAKHKRKVRRDRQEVKP